MNGEYNKKEITDGRKAAHIAGQPSFTVDFPCKWGRFSPRSTASAECLECGKDRYKNAHPANSPLQAAREEARAAGRLHFSTGEPCQHGHISERYVSTTRCVECTTRDQAEQRSRRY